MRALLLLLFMLILAGCAAPSVTADGLVSARSSKFDELYIRPNADLSAYRSVVIEPVPVQFRADYLSQRHGLNYLLAQPMSPPYRDADSVAKDMSALMQASLADAFRASRYEVVATPGPGVLRVTARISDLFINAPDRLSSSVRVTFNRDAGQATLSLEAADAVSGNVLARVVHRNIVREVSRSNVADDTTNRFWFETAFQRWAANVSAELGARRPTEVSLAR
jgi:hypothetical protein